MMIKVRTEDIRNTASRLASCLKKTEYTRMELGETYFKLRLEAVDTSKYDEELIALDQVRNKLDSEINTMQYMSEMLMRVSFELESAEEDILGYEVSGNCEEDGMKVNDLTDYIAVLKEVCEQ